MKFFKKLFGGYNPATTGEKLREDAFKLSNKNDLKSIDQAIDLIKRAIELDPDHLGQKLALAATINIRCKYISKNHHELEGVKLEYSEQLFIDSTVAIEVLNDFLKSGGVFDPDVEQLFESLKKFNKVKKEFKFVRYLAKGVYIYQVHKKNDGKIYEVYKADTKENGLKFLRNIPLNLIPRIYYVIVETPEGTYGKDVNGIYNEGTGEDIY